MANILVIGGSSGIGKATVDRLISLGHYVESPSKADLDVTVTGAIWRYLDRSSPHFDGIVYSAGVNGLSYIGTTPDDETPSHDEIMDVNFNGFVDLLDSMQLDGYGIVKPVSVVAVGSDAADRPMRTSLSYCASKAALHMAVRCAARELGAEGYRINCVAPGMTDGTGMQEYIDRTVPLIRGWTVEEALRYEKSQEVVPGRIHVEEVAQVIISTLFGPAHLNGSIITINGGR